MSDRLPRVVEMWLHEHPELCWEEMPSIFDSLLAQISFHIKQPSLFACIVYDDEEPTPEPPKKPKCECSIAFIIRNGLCEMCPERRGE